jgi:hypothetical protein
MQFRAKKGTTYLIRATYDPATQTAPARIIGKIEGWDSVTLHEGVVLTPAEQAELDAHLAPHKLSKATWPLRHLCTDLRTYLEALEGHPEALSDAALVEHRQAVQEVQKALRRLAAKRRRKAAEPPQPVPLL